MKQSNRMIYFLILNVIVSACTILAILWFWDPGNRPAFLKPWRKSISHFAGDGRPREHNPRR